MLGTPSLGLLRLTLIPRYLFVCEPVLREVILEGVYLRGEAGDPGLIGAVGQAVTVYQLSPNICATPRRPGRKR